MKVIYIKLINVAGLYVGSNIREIEIDLSKSANTIIGIVAKNGSGKSALLSSISPFANVTSIDERSSLSYILIGEDGYKEIHYQDEENVYVIKHYYKATNKSHTVKSYFSMNGAELNETGNVRSFISLVEIHMGLTQDMMRLIRIGSNVGSIISLTPAARKDYVGKLIDEIDIYLQIYKEINDEFRLVKSMISTNDANLYNCHISDIIIEEDSLKQLGKDIKVMEKERDTLIASLARVESLMKSNDIDDLKRKRREAESSIEEFHRISRLVESSGLTGKSVDDLICIRSDTVSRKIDIQSKINSYKLSIDSSLKNIERLETTVNKITSNNDLKSLANSINTLRSSISMYNPIIIKFKAPDGVTSETLLDMINRLSSFNVIGQTIKTFGVKPFKIYMKLISEHKSVDKWLKDQGNKIKSNIKESDLKTIIDLVFKDDGIISPNCDFEFNECPYYRLYGIIDDMKNNIDESPDPETLRYVQIISNNIDLMMNEIDSFHNVHVPDRLRNMLIEKNILDRFNSGLSFFDIDTFQEYLTIVKSSEIYHQDIERLKQYEQQLSIYKSSGVDGQINEIKQLRENIEFYRNNVNTLTRQISDIDSELKLIDSQISIISRYNEIKKYKGMFESTLKSTAKVLEPLECAEQDKLRIELELSHKKSQIEAARTQHKLLEQRITEYNRLIGEGEKLAKKSRHLKIILETVNTKQGIPVKYMKRYLGKIQSLANNLLKIIYGDSFRLAKFNITHDTFDIPYVKNGIKVSDVKYSSQSELSMSTIAISFALSNISSGRYNIPLLDEVDNGLDESNRVSFLKMFNIQMRALNAEQAFIISQNLSQMVNIPMDIIQLGDTGSTKSKLQNIIYTRKED